MTEQGRLIVLSGFTGAGKGTIMKKLTETYPDDYALSVSATTRKPRPGEQEGRDYFFKSEEEFQDMIDRGELLEYARYVDHYYGTPERYVREKLAEGQNVLLEIEIQGGLQIREKFPDTLMLFLVAPSAEALIGRLRGRGSETPAEMTARLNRAIEEADGCESYDYLIVNGDLAESTNRVHQIIQNERCRMRLCLDEVAAIKKELQEYLKGELK